MKTLSIAVLSTTLLMLAGCSDDKSTGSDLPAGDAAYKVTFTSTWSMQTHPDGFPGNPHFSRLVGGTHNDMVSFWDNGGLATQGIQNMAELGATAALESEVQDAIDAGTAEYILVGGGINPSPGSVSLNFSVTSEFPRVTLTSMIAPSPDWFVGVSGLSLWQNDDWVDSLTVDLYLYDAGTDDGTDYTSANAASSPHVPIMPISGYPVEVNDEVPPLGTFTFTRM